MSEPNLNDILSGGGLSSLLQNPDIAAKLPKIMEALGPVMAEMRAEGNDKPNEDVLANKSETPISEAVATASGKQKGQGSARRCALLKALEPYLSPSRRDAMEYIIKVTSLIDMLSEVM